MQQRLKRLDIFPKFDTKFEQDARDKTLFGAALSLASLFVIVVLIISEFRYFLSVERKHELYVDNTDIEGTIPIHINVTFPEIPCDLISIDCLDSFGEFIEGLEQTTVKHRLSRGGSIIEKTEVLVNLKAGDTTEAKVMAEQKKQQHGEDHHKTCASCYGAELHPGECCNTCEEVKMAYARRGWSFHLNDVSIVQCAKERLLRATRAKSHEGCNMFNTVRVRRVQGNLHMVPGRSFVHLGQHVHDIMGEDVENFNMTHIFHSLSFGDPFPGLVNPLESQAHRTTKGHGGGRFQYYVKVVPTKFERLDALSVETNQYSVTEHFSTIKHEEAWMPGVFIIYDLSPIKVHIYETRPYASIVHFLLQLCAISGGVFTVMSLVDAVCYHGYASLRRKRWK